MAGEKYVLIFDMGGGTTDLTILYIKDGKYEIQYTYGQSRLGGEDIDVIMVDHLLELLASGNHSYLCLSISHFLILYLMLLLLSLLFRVVVLGCKVDQRGFSSTSPHLSYSLSKV